MGGRNLQLYVVTTLVAALSTAGLLARLSWSNLDLVILDSLARPFLVIWLATLAIAAILLTISRRLFALAPALVFLLFCYGAAAEIDTWYVPNHVYAAAAIVTVFGLIVHFSRNASALQLAWGSLAIFTAMTVPFATPMLGLMTQPQPKQLAPDFSRYVGQLIPGVSSQPKLPDVIYIVPDRYASRRTLLRTYGIDNNGFYAQLEARGFIVNPDASANYPTTAHSLASTSNSTYLDAFTELYGSATGRLQPLYAAYENSLSQTAMRRLGYRFINAGSWWDASRVNRNADMNIGTNPLDGMNRVSLSEVEQTLWKATPLRDLPGFSAVSAGRTECDRIKHKLRLLSEIGNGDAPVFVQAHMTIPHTPIVADRTGNCLPKSIDFPMPGITWEAFKTAYAEYLAYFNSAILEVIDRQLAMRGPHGRGVIIVIQSDEGPYPLTTRLQERAKDFTVLSESDLKDKLGIINAVYLAGATYVSARDLITPINNWPIILERIAGSAAPRQPHKVYVYRDHQHIYEFTDATGRFLR